MQSKLRCAGHVVSMKDESLPKRITYGQLQSGMRNVGRPLLRYIDKLKDNIKHTEIKPSIFKEYAADRNNVKKNMPNWHSGLHPHKD